MNSIKKSNCHVFNKTIKTSWTTTLASSGVDLLPEDNVSHGNNVRIHGRTTVGQAHLQRRTRSSIVNMNMLNMRKEEYRETHLVVCSIIVVSYI